MLKEIALRLNELMGFNVIPLKNKKPLIEWERWHTEIQSKDDIDIMDWEHATGIGVIMGINDLASIDIDGAETTEVLNQILADMGLPSNYFWVVQSGSGCGFHIYFRFKERHILTEKFGDKAVYKLKMQQDGLCKHIELRLRDCQNAFPPSMHESGGMYDFYFNEPNEAPVYVDAEKVIECIEKNCVIKPLLSDDARSERQEVEKVGYVDLDKLQSALDHLAIHLPAGCYEEWYRIGFALSTLDEDGEELFVKMSLASPHYNTSEMEIRKKFAELSKDYDGRVTLGTIYHLAEQYGWKKPVIHFWYRDEHGNVKISRTRLKRYLEGEGYSKLKKDGTYLYIRIVSNIAAEFDKVQVKDFVMGYLYSLPAEEFEDISRTEIIDALMKGANVFFSEHFFEFLITKNINFKRDTFEEAYLYFENGFLTVTADDVTLKSYKEMEGHIWEKQIIKRKYYPTNVKSDFEEFLHNACRKQIKRTRALKTGIGYLLHLYKDPNNARAMIFIDEKLSEGAFGRSGKGLVIKAISKLRTVVIEDGRNFDVGKNFAFQRVNADTNIVAIEDMRENFPFDKLFSIITEGLTIEKKQRDEIFIQFHESPKIVISSNFTIKGVDDSTLDRQFIVEFSDHYNRNNRPIDEFGKLFFEGWTDSEWYAFDGLMIECLQLYLKYGLVGYDYINLERKQLTVETCPEFNEFSERFVLEKDYDKKELYEDFKKEYEDFEKLSQGKFTRWLKVYARILGYEPIEGKSGATRTILFKKLSRAA